MEGLWGDEWLEETPEARAGQASVSCRSTGKWENGGRVWGLSAPRDVCDRHRSGQLSGHGGSNSFVSFSCFLFFCFLFFWGKDFKLQQSQGWEGRLAVRRQALVTRYSSHCCPLRIAPRAQGPLLGDGRPGTWLLTWHTHEFRCHRLLPLCGVVCFAGLCIPFARAPQHSLGNSSRHAVRDPLLRTFHPSHAPGKDERDCGQILSR